MSAPGTHLPTRRIDGVSAEKMKTMAALLRDPNPIHFDAEAVRALGMGDRPVNQGPTNVGYVVDMLLAWSGGGAGAIRRLTVRFTGNVFADDVVEAGGVVTDVRDDAGSRVATCEVWLDRPEDGARLVHGTAEVALAGDGPTD